jgi:Protein of unknown function (DUF4235)
MMKIFFIPVSIAGGFLGGFLGKKAFEQLWGLIDEEEPPEPEHRQTSWARLMVAMALRGATFQVVRAAVERGSRIGFYRVMGSWPGEEAPEPE